MVYGEVSELESAVIHEKLVLLDENGEGSFEEGVDSRGILGVIVKFFVENLDDLWGYGGLGSCEVVDSGSVGHVAVLSDIFEYVLSDIQGRLIHFADDESMDDPEVIP